MPRQYEHPDVDQIQLTEVLAALGDPVRLGMVRVLASDAEVSSLELSLRMPKSTVAHHTKTLREAGVIHIRAEGRHGWISLRREALQQRFPGVLEAILAAAAE